MPAARSLYDILNVTADAEPVVIEAAYRALMKKYHPDQAAAEAPAGGPSAADINKAYAVLRDPERRAEYDHREWRHQQNIQLAHYQPPPPPIPRHSRVFGWGGWTVALVMGGVVAVMAMRAEDIALTKAQAARAAAALTEPDFRSQPTLPDVPLSPTSSEIRAAAYAAEGARARTEAAAKAKAAPDPMLELREVPSRAAAARAAPRRQAPRKPRTAEEKDFLEREGYIY